VAKHRKFNADRFLDKFQGQEQLLRAYVAQWDGKLPLSTAALDVPVLKEFLANGDGDGKDAMMEGLYRAHDLSTERGHEDLIAACRDWDIDPDPGGQLPVECLSLKVLTENEEAFNLAYDRNTLWLGERFSIFRGKSAKAIPDPAAVAREFQEKLAEAFREDKDSDRVLVRQYREEPYVNFIVYHEKRTKAELVFTGPKSKQRVMPQIWRPAQQDFISYNHETGQVDIEARFEHEETALRKHFAECCLADAEFFESPEASQRLNLTRITESDFSMPVNEDHTAELVELQFSLMQQHGPSFVVRSRNVLETLDKNYLRKKLVGGTIRRAVFKIGFPDDRRGKRVELSGSNKVKFKRATHAEDVFRYLNNWGVVLG
jgi:hypothetical protein